ncbi:scamp family-domain-containing protein, partial [Entophlyctis helioformis]
LAAKEAELQRREAELAAREAQLSGGGKPQQPPPKAGKPQQQQQPAVVDRSNNFPSCWPLVYHNLSVDIPPHVRHLATYLYVGWSAFVGLLLWNAVACFSMLVAHAAGVTTAASDFGLSVMYGLVLPVVSFISWYRPVYRAFARNSSLGFMVYFVFGSMHIMFCGYMALGIPGSGSAGGINMIAMFTDKKILAGVCCAIAFVGWAVSGLYFLVLLKRVHSAYRNGGMSMEGAQNEALQSVASNGAVRSAA